MNKHLFNNWDRWHPVTPFIGSKHLQLVCVGNEGPQALAQCPVSSCLFVNFGRQQAFSLYYFGCGMQQAFYQNPSVRKTLLSFVWWKPGEFTRFSPSFHQVLAFTKISPGFANSPGFHQFSPRHGPSLISSPSFHQVVYKNHQAFTKLPSFEIAHQVFTKIKKNGEFTKFWF